MGLRLFFFLCLNDYNRLDIITIHNTAHKNVRPVLGNEPVRVFLCGGAVAAGLLSGLSVRSSFEVVLLLFKV